MLAKHIDMLENWISTVHNAGKMTRGNWRIILLNIMFHVLMVRFKSELFIFITYFSTIVPIKSWFFSCRPFVVNATFSTGLVVSSVSLIFKSLIISIVRFRNLFCCLVWAVDLGVQIIDEGRSFYIGSFCPAMTSLSRYLEEAAFSISISSSVFIFLKKTLPSSVIWTPRSTAQTKQQNTFWNPTIKIMSDLNSNCQQPKPGRQKKLQDLL